MSRRIAREKVLQAVFSVTVGKTPIDYAIEIIDDEDFPEQDKQFARNYLHGLLEHLAELDTKYVPFLKDWQLERLANVDRSLLRMAVYEMLYLKDIPANVTINEAVELAKIFGGEESPKFVNAVLDSVNKEIRRESEETHALSGD